MPTDYNGFGALRFPAPDVTSAYDLDPGHQAILGLLTAAINAELGSAWNQVIARLGADHYAKRDGLYLPVATSSPVALNPQQMTQWKASWPILAVYREGEPQLSYMTTGGYRQLIQEWSADWIIGPLTASHTITVGKFANAVAAVIDSAIMHGRHSAFESGKRQFFGQFVSIETKSIQGPGYSQSMTEESGSGYYGLTVSLESIERNVFDGASSTFEQFYVPAGTETADDLQEAWVDVGIDNDSIGAVDEEIGD